MRARRSERATVAWSFGLFFCVFASWYLLRPLRDAMAVVGEAREVPRLFLLTLGLTLLLAPFVSAAVSRLPRRRFVSLAYRFLAATLVGFFFVLRRPDVAPGAARAFFVWASVFNLLAITLGWSLMADVFSRAQGIRLFALIGGGGSLGALLGSLLTALLVERTGAAATLLPAALLLECAVACVNGVARSAPAAAPRDDTVPTGGTLRWLATAVRDPFLLAICAYLVLFTFSSTFLYLEQARIVKAAIPTTAGRAALFARMDLAVNAATLLLQVFVVGRTLRHVGIATALAVLPVFTFGCFVALRVAPVLAVLVVCQVARRTLDFAVTKPAREVLFTVVRPEDKYKAKSFVDTFVYRSGDALGAVSFEGAGGPVLVGAMAVLCVAWLLLGVSLGRAQR
ncbi:MAG TPA: MFS transporter [Polyangiaceae bacterium]|jgi:AAA family ATP:ADP antiporter